jgi:peptide/nickel transport system substrate-binding protein
MSEIEQLSQALRAAKVTRREFIQRSTALGLTLALAETLSGNILQAATPKRGGFARLGFASGATTDTMDPGTWPGSFAQNLFGGSVCNRLTHVQPNGDITTDLAESVEPSNGAKTWVVKLRKGLTFHDGKPVTSKDVYESMWFHANPQSKSAAKSLLADVDSIKIDGDDTVIFTLRSGNLDFPYGLADYHMVILPAKEGGGVRFGVGTGPFVLEKFDPGVSAKLKRFANYHKTGMPYFDEVEYVNIPDATARANALTSGEIHYMDHVPFNTVSLLARNHDIAIADVPSYEYVMFCMKIGMKPFDDPNVRLALKYAIDREEIVKKIYYGHGTPGNDNPIAPSVKYAIQPQPKHLYDVEKAKFYLKKAGLSTLHVDLSVADQVFEGCVDAGLLYKEQARKAGIDINVIREPNNGYYANVWNVKPFTATEWFGRPTIDGALSLEFDSKAAWNDTDWRNPKFDGMLREARASFDTAKRAALYAEMQQMLHDQSGALIIAFGNYVSAYSKKLAHGPLSGVLPDDNFGVSEHWWFV